MVQMDFHSEKKNHIYGLKQTKTICMGGESKDYVMKSFQSCLQNM